MLVWVLMAGLVVAADGAIPSFKKRNQQHTCEKYTAQYEVRLPHTTRPPCYTRLLFGPTFNARLLSGPTIKVPTFVDVFTSQIRVGANVMKSREIYRLSVTNVDGNTFTCNGVFSKSGGGGAPINGDEFTFSKDATTAGEFKIEVTALADRTGPLDGGATYTCAVTCTDDVTNQQNTISIEIFAVPGQKLDFGNNLPASKALDVNTAASKAFQSLGTKTASNDLGKTTRYYLISESPDLSGINGNPFFSVGETTGEVTILQDLALIPKDDTPDGKVNLAIRAVADDINNTDIFTLALSNQNAKCFVADLPKAVSLPENYDSADAIFTMTISDPDTTSILQTLDYTVTQKCFPSPEGDEIFTIDTGSTRKFHITSGKSMNYETTKVFNCTFICNDGKHDGDIEFIEITVEDVNDACVFDTSTPYTAIMTEGGTGGGYVNPGFKVFDEDSLNGKEPLNFTFVNANNSGRFAIDATSGAITFNEPYEIDGSSPYPTEVYLTVVAFDDGDGTWNDRLSCSAQVKITIVDANDNAPSICSSKTIYATNIMTAGSTVVGQLSPTDADSGDNGVVTCAKASSSGVAETYYSVTGNGDILLSKALYENGAEPLSRGSSAQYIIVCTDKGTPPLASTCTVDVIYQWVDTTTVSTAATTTTEKNFFDFPAAIALSVLLGLLGLALLGLALYFCLRFCCGMCQGGTFCDCGGRCCEKRHQPRRVTPDTPVKRERTPVIVRKEPRIIQQPQQIQVVRTIARPTYGMRTLGTMPMRTGAIPFANGYAPPAYMP